MAEDKRPELVDDIDDVLNDWIDDTIEWERFSEQDGCEQGRYYQEILIAFDYLCDKLIPARIEHVKFLLNHDHDYDVDGKCHHCKIDISKGE